ncbi:rhomboid family intramembrane serine protease [Cellvibrio polysaccharolyticus]|uniref:Rhomboid family intramembrane serine protease n=1 Tax=Cellvibrio polysaccharolyticus TaxID=2082724 RepID=A0A928V2L7_9GAMM|nr:rhomboid family intramembrane serine protease [Cellvibrio polysaccharolyticus]MBE8717142.1 rhomboid family intramembrane serine protease [Cellvibrio polysaccharolyticus]
MSAVLNCPHCGNVSMELRELHGHELQTCPQCHGLWCDDGDLSTAIRNKNGMSDAYCIKQGFGETLDGHHYECHRCHVPMKQVHLLKDYHVTLDTCPTCSGIWVDGDEVSMVLAAPKLQDALEQLNAKVNTKSWLFQFLTRMPREYNIKPHRKPWMTWSLLLINTLIFFAYGFDEVSTDWVYTWFAVDSEPLLRGEHLWSLLSYQFLHGGIIHLVGNLYFLWIIGDNLEDALGPWKYLAAYLFCGVIAALVELLASQVSRGELLMVGASGSVAGLFGMYLIWFRHASITFMFVVWQKKLKPVWYFAIWAGINIFGLMSEDLSVAYWAHLGGLAAGLLVGVIWKEKVLAHNPLIQMLQRPEARIIR